MQIITISGGSGSGKTTLANKFSKFLKHTFSIINLDNYYMNLNHLDENDLRSTVNRDIPNSFDISKLNEHIRILKSGNSVLMPSYDFNNGKIHENVTEINPPNYLLIEGLFSSLIEISNFSVYIDVTEELIIKRNLNRITGERFGDKEFMIERLNKMVLPAFREYNIKQKNNVNFIFNGSIEIGTNEYNKEMQNLYNEFCKFDKL
jgi:uridine kinase